MLFGERVTVYGAICQFPNLDAELGDVGCLQFDETQLYIVSLAGRLVSCEEAEGRKGKLLEASKGEPWTVPREGFYHISFKAARFPGDVLNVETEAGLEAMMDNIRHMNLATERLRMFDNAALNTDLSMTAKQAETLASLVEHDQDRVVTAEKLLGQVVNPEERIHFLDSFLDSRQRLRVAVRMRGLFRAVMGNPTGPYMIDLGSTRGRLTAQTLEEIANAERSWGAAHGAADVSQKGNRTPFRNEVLDTVPQALSLEWFVHLPRRGHLRLDFVPSVRPRLSVCPLSEDRFEALKSVLGVHNEMQEIKHAYSQLEMERGTKKGGGAVRMWREATVFARTNAAVNAFLTPHPSDGNSGDGRDPSQVVEDEDPASEAKAANPSFSTARTTVSPEAVSGGESAEVDSPGDGGPFSSGGDATPSAPLVTYHSDVNAIFRAKGRAVEAPVPSFEVPDCISGLHVTDQWQQFRSSSHQLFDFFEPANKDADKSGFANTLAAPPAPGAGESAGGTTGGGGSSGGTGGAPGEALPAGSGTVAPSPGAPQGGRGESGAAAGGGVAVPTRLYRWVFHRLLLLETSACAAWYTCEQAMEIVSSFPWQDYGRVQAIIFIFSRIVDVEHFNEVVLPGLKEEERRELHHRLGILNILNPMKPDGPYELDLRCWEQREWSKILIKLAVEEPGPNWADESYAHARGAPEIWGWLLPENWTREDEEMGGDGGPRRTGILRLRYLTDPALGCVAKWDVRRALRARTLAGIKRDI